MGTILNIIKRTSTVHTSSRSAKIKYIVIHYTAGVSSRVGSARGVANYFAIPTSKGGRDGSADFIVDDAEIVQYNPDIEKRMTWHCGGKLQGSSGASFHGICTNSNSIGIEICSNNKTGKVTAAGDGNWYYTDASIKNAVALTKELMQMFGIPAKNVIRHWDVTGKLCPSVKGWYGSDSSAWNAFKAQLNQTEDKTESNGYVVEVKSPDGTLNLRDKPKTGKIIEVLKNGQRVRIVAIDGNWGMNEWNRWLNLNYTKVVRE